MSRRIGLVCVLATISAVLLCSQARAGAPEWPQWRGPERTGVSTETGLLKEWPTAGPAKIWTTTGLGEGYSGISVKDGRIYTMGASDGGDAVIALDFKTGKQLWATKTSDKVFNDGRGNGPRCTPTCDGSVLYAEDAFGNVVCLEAATGKQLWKIALTDLGGKRPNWGFAESPLVLGNALIVTPGGRGGAIAALDKKTGKLIWQSKEVTTGAAYSSPVYAELGGKKQIIQGLAARLVSVDATNGKLLWDMKNGMADIYCTTPVVAGDVVVGTSGYNKGTGAMRVNAQGAQSAWFEPSFGNHHGGVVLVGGYLYGLFDGGRGSELKCVDPKTGKVVWSNGSVGKGSLTCADGMLYLLSEGNTVGLAEATPDGYKEHGRFKIPKSGKPSWAHPVVVNGCLFICDQDTLTCYDVKGR